MELSGPIKIGLAFILFAVCVGLGARLEYEGVTAWVMAAALLLLWWWTRVSPNPGVASFQKTAFIVALIVSLEFFGTTAARHDIARHGRQDRLVARVRENPEETTVLLRPISRDELQDLRARLTPEVDAELARRKLESAKQFRIREAEAAKLERERAANPVRMFFGFIGWLIHPTH